MVAAAATMSSSKLTRKLWVSLQRDEARRDTDRFADYMLQVLSLWHPWSANSKMHLETEGEVGCVCLGGTASFLETTFLTYCSVAI